MTAGAVLCGGSSRRMGTDKAFVEVDGVAMAERVAAGARRGGGCDPVVFVGGDTALLARFGRERLPDRYPGEGPVGGVLTALRAVGDDVVVAACDLPLLDAGTVRVARRRAARRTSTSSSPPRTGPQPALAWWSAAARTSRRTAVGCRRRRSLHELVTGSAHGRRHGRGGGRAQRQHAGRPVGGRSPARYIGPVPEIDVDELAAAVAARAPG